MSKSIAKLSEFSSELEELLGETVLLKGEDEELYAELREALKAHLDPQDLFDELDVQDLANNIWEGRRFQKHATELINAERLNAIKKLAASRPGFLSDKMAKRIGVTGDSIPEDAIGQGVYLGELGVSRELVQAKALLLAADDYLILDKLVANRSARRKAAIKDYSKRRRQADKEARLASKAKRRRAKLANFCMQFKDVMLIYNNQKEQTPFLPKRTQFTVMLQGAVESSRFRSPKCRSNH